VGQTPVVRHRYAHDRISAISGIAVSPKRRRCTLYCQLYEDNIQGDEAAAFLRQLLRQIPGHLVVLLDNGGIHRGDPVRDLLSHTSRLHLEPFPPYIPELNPDEGVWNHLKAQLANGRPDTQAELRGCIEQSDLPPFFTLGIALFMRQPIVISQGHPPHPTQEHHLCIDASEAVRPPGGRSA
jgi:putative transposase